MCQFFIEIFVGISSNDVHTHTHTQQKKLFIKKNFADEYFVPTKISKLYYSAIILAVNRKFYGVLG